MSTTRSDAWSEQDDSFLAQIVIQHIKNGSTQLRAFDEIGQKLGRTSAACGFRWNSNVRKIHEQDILLAKTYRQAQKNNKRSHQLKMAGISDQDIDFSSLIAFLKSLKITYIKAQSRIDQLKTNLDEANKRLSLLKLERERLLSHAAAEKSAVPDEANEDYRALLAILQHANRLMQIERVSELHHEKTG
ncbi:RsfA family transcriptional regulator [Paenibacillus taichungensis]